MPKIYHFTDIGNLPEILRAGELRCHRVAPTTVDVGDASIKARRTSLRVACGPGGQVCDYVPFYYAPRSPMLFSIKSGNVEGVSQDQRRLAYLVSSTEAAYAAGLGCVFTDGNAAVAITRFSDDPGLLDELVDWSLMHARYWANLPEDPDRRRRRMAEFLVHRALRLQLVTELGVRDTGVRDRVVALARRAGRQMRVIVREDWYF